LDKIKEGEIGRLNEEVQRKCVFLKIVQKVKWYLCLLRRDIASNM